MTERAVRSPWQVTRSVWKALFLREFMTRVTKDRLAWFWMLFEPIAIVLAIIMIRTLILGRSAHVFGAELVPWLLTGLLSFFLFRENMMSSLNIVEASRVLFSYRQVKPVDPVFVRCFLEGWLKTFIFAGFIATGVLLGIEIFPHDFIFALFAWVSLWLLGVGVSLVLSASAVLVRETGNIMRVMSLPLLLISGAIVPMQLVPDAMLSWILLNPILHGIELLRVAFFETYAPVDGISLLYLWGWILYLLMLGLMMHIRFEKRLKAL